ncbi:hypothetical protein [Streptomyces sp. WAC08241]|uniref:hypothetical protein n=1 Tax=Streptomyces sp. WAC08241 TaxID=2487421 RepID=UPI000F7B3F91|nr:hypothetical protein [Streptomyces sp. WAC08241]RSS43822.1 hypothetical protein EF906_08720 [Streptomyces sp. WAC08241]
MSNHVSLGEYQILPEETPRPALVPNPVDQFVTTVVSGDEPLSEEQRIRVRDWLLDNGVDTMQVSIRRPITVEGRIYQGEKQDQVICFSEFRRNEAGRRYVDPCSKNEAMVIQRTVPLRVELGPDPQDTA